MTRGAATASAIGSNHPARIAQRPQGIPHDEQAATRSPSLRNQSIRLLLPPHVPKGCVYESGHVDVIDVEQADSIVDGDPLDERGCLVVALRRDAAHASVHTAVEGQQVLLQLLGSG